MASKAAWGLGDLTYLFALFIRHEQKQGFTRLYTHTWRSVSVCPKVPLFQQKLPPFSYPQMPSQQQLAFARVQKQASCLLEGAEKAMQSKGKGYTPD